MNSPVFIATWPFGLEAARVGYQCLQQNESSLDAIEKAANTIELDRTVTSVGAGGMPNAEGVLELDAAIMDGKTHSAGSVAGLIGISRPISVARKIMETTPHVMLVGSNALRFALKHGFQEEELRTEESIQSWLNWKKKHISQAEVAHFEDLATPQNHDTIGLCALDASGTLSAGCTTSGLAWKLPGRVGDSPLIGSGLYVDNEVGAAAATGDGDEMMKVTISSRVVALMAAGASPQAACETALRYLLRKRPASQHKYGAAVIALNTQGETAGAATLSGFSQNHLWQWAVASRQHPGGRLLEGPYITPDSSITSLLDKA